MLRVRIDGGQLTTEQLRVIAGISNEFGRGTADLTDRQNIQLHWIEVESMPEIWRRLEAVGLGTTEACGDVPRVVLGSPVAGIAADELIDPTPQIDEITSRFIGDASLANLPRKFKSAITGHPSQDVVHEINDVAFVAVEHPELGIGYDLWVGGGLSTTPRLGERLGVFVAPEQVADAWHGVAQIFRDYGYRRLRNKARLKFLLAEWGTEKFRQVLQDEYLGYALPDGPPAPKPKTQGDHVGVHRQKDGRFYVGVDADRRPRLGPDPREARRPRRGARLDPPAHDAAPEARDPRHPRGPRRVAHRRPRRARPLGASEPDPPRHHRVHGHRVLQARDRRDQGVRDGGRARPRGASRAVRAAASDQPARQRLPQLVRAHPDRRHRAQGPARHDRRRAGARLPGAPRRRARRTPTATRPASAAPCAA